jgi:hypothetical protein
MIDAKRLDELRAEHGEVFAFHEGGESVACKRPTRAQYKRFRKERLDDRKASEALETLFEGCLVFPPFEEFEAVLERKPALADVFGGLLVAAAGGDDPEGKK